MTPPLRRRALLIGTETYRDDRFPDLPSCRADVWQLKQVLDHPGIGAFASVAVAVDLDAADMRRAVSGFLESCGVDDLALLYISGHGVRLSQSTGEFCFVARDTDHEHLQRSAVGASFVNDELESCLAPQKVVILDCCQSGGFVQGWRTGDVPMAKSLSDTPVSSKGAYVIASSGAGEASFADGLGPSLFTAELVEALRGGKAGRAGSEQVGVDDLFSYVSERMRAQGRQRPEKSSLAVNGKIVLARCPQVPPALKPLTARQPVASVPSWAKSSEEPPDWGRLLAYHRMCVQAEALGMPLMTVAGQGVSYVCLTGAERFVSGDAEAVRVTPEIQKFVDSVDTESELWAGYPVVVLPAGRGEQRARFAPLVIRRVEVVTEGGTTRLKPYGSVIPHTGLARHVLGPEQAADLARTYQEGWLAGQHSVMADNLGAFLRTEYEIPVVQELRPTDLDSHLDLRSPGRGARNAALLFRVSPTEDISKSLLRDLAAVEGQLQKVAGTALAALWPGTAEPKSDGHAELVVTPLPANAAQLDVIRSAMTRRLTVATGPPGTGKSQLVANMIATAVANGQRVLVASTNNEAVDEVVRRCDDLIPDSVIRTGNKQKQRPKETASLNRLAAVRTPPGGLETARADLLLANDDLDVVMAELGEIGATERDLAGAGQEREGHAAALGQTVETLAERLASDRDLRRALRAGQARLFGAWRRARLLRRLGLAALAGDDDVRVALTGFAASELRLRELRARTVAWRDDAGLTAALERAEQQVRVCSKRLAELEVASGAARGRRAVRELVQAGEQGGRDWYQLKLVLEHLRAWAVTSMSARRFPPEPALFDLVVVDEASQCAIPHVIPLLFRARRALIIGDVMQLPHIATLSADQEARIRREAGLRPEWLEEHKLSYRRHSTFHAAEAAHGGSLLLDEHYRCHPDIGQLANRLFYGGALEVLTDTRNRPSVPGEVIRWTHVRGRASRPATLESWLNQAEADKVVTCVDYLLERLPSKAKIGVVTPFKAQADLLTRMLDGRKVRVGTVHTFQGGECDAMILSLVATEEMREGAVSWIERQPNLWNVAITRARSLLVVVGDQTFWSRRGGVAAGLLQPDADPPPPDELLLRLYRRLSADPSATVELGEKVDGHRVDVVVRRDGVSDAVLLDRGAPADRPPGRHLDVMLRKRRLLDPAVRAQAWRLYD
ncbi:AAA domain-containing protein [Nonomuraea sp. NPDC050556]|uniref:caspase, EACC1-associated type n=1 Tax=Nonomuraea sp. NPDC050556 TaxID=3364369 RepID=UPI003787A2C4